MIEGQEGVTWREWVDLATEAEELGLDGLFRSDHYSSFHRSADMALDAWATITALAPLTERIRLGTLVSAAAFRHPSELARVVVTADHISNGRIELGVGAGWFEGEHLQNGFPFPSVRERFDVLSEYLDILVRSWSAETFDYHGAHFNLEQQRALPLPLQSPHPPIILGGSGRPRSVALAALFAQEYNAAFLQPEECAELRNALNSACIRTGRDPSSIRLSVMTFLAIGEDRLSANQRLNRGLEYFKVPDESCKAVTVEEATELLGRYARAGVSCLYLQLPDRTDMKLLELMGQLAEVVAN